MLLRSIEKVESCTGFSNTDIFAKAKDIEMRNMVRVLLIMFAPLEPTCCTSEMSVNEFPAASSVCNC
jgi:hypothetical protein